MTTSRGCTNLLLQNSQTVALQRGKPKWLWWFGGDLQQIDPVHVGYGEVRTGKASLGMQRKGKQTRQKPGWAFSFS